MSQLLGELLVKAGIITEAQLEEAINSQVIFGGRLGTNLLELEYIDEPTLCKFLSAKHGVPYIDLRGKLQVDQGVIKLVPKSIAAKHKVFPLKLEGRTLHLVCLDPSDLTGIDEVKFLTGKNLQLYVAPEIRIYAALEKLYGIKRDIRFITLSRKDTEEFIREHKSQILQKEGGKGSLPRKKEQIPSELPSELKPLEGDEELASIEEPLLLDEVVHEAPVQETPSEQEEIIELTEEVVEEEKIVALSFSDAMALLEKAASREEIGKILLGFCMNKFTRSVLFTVQKGRVLPWDCLGQDIAREKILKFVLPLTQPSVFKLTYDTKCHFIGPVPNTIINDEFLRRLGNGRPASALLMPVMFKGNLVLIIYGDNGPDEYVSTDIGEIMILAQKVPQVFENLVKRRKQMFKSMRSG
jgi:hypothetical protein